MDAAAMTGTEEAGNSNRRASPLPGDLRRRRQTGLQFPGLKACALTHDIVQVACMP